MRCLLACVGLFVATTALAADRDGDGVDDSVDNCLGIANPGQENTSANRFGDACVDPSATVDDSVDLGFGATIAAGANVATDAVIGDRSTVGIGATIGVGAQLAPSVTVADGASVLTEAQIGRQTVVRGSVGASAVVGRACVIGTNVVVEHDAIIGYGAQIAAAATAGSPVTTIGAHSVVGNLATLGQYVAIGRGAHVFAAQLSDQVRVGAGSEVGAGAQLGVGTKVRRDAAVGSGVVIGNLGVIARDVVLEDFARLGLGVTVRSGARVGTRATLADATIVPRGAVIAGTTLGGTGADGDVTISSTVDLNRHDTTATIDRNGAYADGIAYFVVGSTAGATLNLGPIGGGGSPDGLAVGDEVLVWTQSGKPGLTSDLGKVRFGVVASKSGTSITLEQAVGYVSGDQGGAYTTFVQRIPHYHDVTITPSGTLTASPTDAFRAPSGIEASYTGLVAFRASGTVTVQGSIDVSGDGFHGGAYQSSGYAGASGWGPVDEHYYPGAGVGNCFAGSWRPGGSGGGGSYGDYGTAGDACACSGGARGSVYGDAALDRWHVGTGGGAGGKGDSYCTATSGGFGGGMIFVAANSLVVTGTIRADGTNGGNGCGQMGGFGGGSGGSIHLSAGTMTLPSGAVTAAGGIGGGGGGECGGTFGGNGGSGRIRLDYDLLGGQGFPNSAAEADCCTPAPGHSERPNP